jgi:hypothetical protein
MLSSAALAWYLAARISAPTPEQAALPLSMARCFGRPAQAYKQFHRNTTTLRLSMPTLMIKGRNRSLAWVNFYGKHPK